MNGFFVAGEFALLTVDRGKVEQLARRGERGGASILGALRTLSFQLSGAQLGITITSLLLGFIVEATVGRALEPLVARATGAERALEIATALGLVLVTAAQMVLAELTTKNLAIARPLELARAIAGPLRFVNASFRPVIAWLNGAANWTVRRFGIEPREELVGVPSMQELKRLIHSSRQEGVLPEEEFALLNRSINFSRKTTDDALVPRVSIVALKAEDTLQDLARAAASTGHSRFPVTREGGLDDIVGVVLVKDAYKVPLEKRAETSVTEVMQEPLFVPESRPLDSLLAEMRRERKHLAVVVDEYGGTAGIITLEDLLEEIVGEIDDEYDPEDARPELTSPDRGIHIVSGMLHPDEVFEATGFEIPEAEHYETLAGFLLSLLGRVPSQGDHASYGRWELKVVEMEGRRIAQVLIVAPPASAEAER